MRLALVWIGVLALVILAAIAVSAFVSWQIPNIAEWEARARASLLLSATVIASTVAALDWALRP